MYVYFAKLVTGTMLLPLLHYQKTFPRCHNFKRTLLMTSHQSIKGSLSGIHKQPMYQEKEKRILCMLHIEFIVVAKTLVQISLKGIPIISVLL